MTPLPLTEADAAVLAETRGWARFIAVVYWIGVAVLSLALLASQALTAALGRSPNLSISGVLALMIVAGAVYALLNWRYAAGLQSYGQGQAQALVGAFRSLRFLWVFTLVFYAASLLYTVVNIVGVVAGAGTVEMTR